MKYILTTNSITEDYDTYIINLLTLAFTIPEGLIPYRPEFGFTTTLESTVFTSAAEIAFERAQNCISSLGIEGVEVTEVTLDPLVVKVKFKGKEHEIKGRN